MKTTRFFSLSLVLGLVLLVLGFVLLVCYAQQRGAMAVVSFVLVGAGCTVLGNVLGKFVTRIYEARFLDDTIHRPPKHD
jgi:uncharacterized membrane protein (DUF485 family)